MNSDDIDFLRVREYLRYALACLTNTAEDEHTRLVRADALIRLALCHLEREPAAQGREVKDANQTPTD